MLPAIAVILTDAHRRIQWVNHDFTQITGYALQEVIGKKPGRILQGPGSEREAVCRIREGLNKQVPIKDQILNYRKNGESYPCNLVIYPIFDLAGRLTNFIAFEVDGSQVPDDAQLPIMQLKEKYGSSSLKGVREVALYQQFLDLLERQKLFLKPDLSLREVAGYLNTNTKYLSQVVNHFSGHNFQYTINRFRVEEVKANLLDKQYDNYTLFGIALQCGFKNKSTFYKVFKDITGLTPKSYVQREKELKAQS